MSQSFDNKYHQLVKTKQLFRRKKLYFRNTKEAISYGNFDGIGNTVSTF